MTKLVKRLSAAAMAGVVAISLAISISASTVCPPHKFELKNTTSTVIRATPHTYVESVTNGQPKYGTCIIEEIRTVKAYHCICGETKTETSLHTRHTKCGQ